MEFFVEKGSVVREIWGKGDTILLIFAGAAAEFALNKAVDWLYFTGRLPADPFRRLFSTVVYARRIVFSDMEGAYRAIDQLAAIHAEVEAKRGTAIPEWAYRDVLFMLIDYSIRAFELLERKLTATEKEEVYQVFYRLGDRMDIPGLPADFQRWLSVREQHLQEHLERSSYTVDLYKQYRKHLGILRYYLLLQAQILIVPERVNNLLRLGKVSLLTPLIALYKLGCQLNMEWLLKSLILPSAYKVEIKALDHVPS